MPSRYQEGLKKTKELQDLKEEEEEQKSESPEEPEEAEETEEEERDPRSRLEPWPLLKWVTIHLTAQHLWRCQSRASVGPRPNEQPTETKRHSCWGRRQRKSQRVKIVNKGAFAELRGQRWSRVGPAALRSSAETPRDPDWSPS